MSIKKVTTSAIVAVSLIAASLSPLATAANAAPGWKKYNDKRAYSRHYDGPRHNNRFAHKRDHDRRHYHGHKHNSGKNVAKGIAIGLGILAVGSILASGAHR